VTAKDTRFQPGNRAAVTHGARSQRVRAEKRRELAQTIRDQVLTQWAHLAAQGPLLDLLVDCLADVAQLRAYVDEHGGPVGGRGRLLKPMELLRAREHDVLALCDRLLLAPRELARLGPAAGLTTGVQVRVMEAQRRLRERAAGVSNGHRSEGGEG
jgi:hypothetical protein